MRLISIAAIAAAAFLAISPVRAQTPPENLAAARQLVGIMKSADQFKAILPTIFDNLKPVFVQDRPEMEKDWDAIMPVIIKGANSRVNEFADKIAAIYANNFTVSELNDLIAFYQSPTGQKFIARQQAIAMASMTVGQQFGQELVADLKQEITDELRKREHAQ
jgi:uncharacterized protein